MLSYAPHARPCAGLHCKLTKGHFGLRQLMRDEAADADQLTVIHGTRLKLPAAGLADEAHSLAAQMFDEPERMAQRTTNGSTNERAEPNA